MAESPAALIAAHRGPIEDARNRSERALVLAEADGIRLGESGHRWVLGFIELSLGDAAKALGQLDSRGRSANGLRFSSSRATASSLATRWRR